MNEAGWGFFGVLVGAVIPLFNDWISNKRILKKNGRYLAVRVACILDLFSETTAEIVRDDGTYLGEPAGSDGSFIPQIKLPTGPVYPLDVDWKSIEPQLMYRLLSLPTIVESANSRIRDASELDGPPEYEFTFEERQFQYAVIGLEALKLSEELRKNYNLPQRSTNDWNSERYFESKKVQVESIRNERAIKNKIFREF